MALLPLRNLVRERWRAGIPTLNGWLSMPTSIAAEIMARAGYDALTIDMQHGVMDYRNVLEIVTALTATDVVPVVRVPSSDPTFVTRVLDLGVLGVICPLIGNAAQAREFGAGCRYHPLGNRSFGPLRAPMVYGRDYAARANEAVLALGMIETAGAIAELEQILDVETLDGIYIGPADLGIALGMAPGMDREEPDFLRLIEDIARKANARGKVPGIHTTSSRYAARAINMGFGFVTVAGDARHVAVGAESIVRETRELLKPR